MYILLLHAQGTKHGSVYGPVIIASMHAWGPDVAVNSAMDIVQLLQLAWETKCLS